MSTTQEQGHTPGPWYPFTDVATKRLHIVDTQNVGINTVQICSFDGSSFRDVKETIANARLIAAAPEMLEALKEAQNQIATMLFEAGRYGLSNERINSLSAANLIAIKAIAKAEGVK